MEEKKMGRPKKDSAELRDKIIRVRVSKKEYDSIASKAKACNRSINCYARYVMRAGLLHFPPDAVIPKDA